jgi:hypothetical protein
MALNELRAELPLPFSGAAGVPVGSGLGVMEALAIPPIHC